MNRSWMKVRRTLILLAMGASTFGLFGTSFGLGNEDWGGCNYALNTNYETMFRTIGHTVIDNVYTTYFEPIGADYDTYIGEPTRQLAKDMWTNWVNYRVPDDPTVK